MKDQDIMIKQLTKELEQLRLENNELKQNISVYRGHMEQLLANRTDELQLVKEEYTAVNEELTATNEELVAINEELRIANEHLNLQISKSEQLQEELDQFFNLSPDIFWIIGFDRSIKRINSKMAEILGYEESYLSRMPVEDMVTNLVHPDDQQATRERFINVVSEGKSQLNYINRYLHSDGTYRWLSWSAVPHSESKVVYMVARDITERINMEAELAQSEERFRTAFENIMDCLSVYSAVRNEDGRVIDFRYDYVNEAVVKTLNVPRERLVGNTLLGLYPGHLESGLFAKYCELVETGEPLTFESLTYERDDLSLALDIRMVKLGDGFVASWHDITERKKMEEKLRQSENLFSSIFTASPLSISLRGLNDGVYVDVNPSFEALTGYTREEVIGNTAAGLMLFADQEGILANPKKITKSGRVKNLEEKLSRKSGEIRDILASTEIIEINGQRLVLTITSDITGKKSMEKELSRLDRLNLIGQMAAGIGHEVRNPMTTVRGLLQLLGTKPETKKYEEFFQLMIGELDRANSIITDFLSLAKNKPVEQKKHNLNTIVTTLSPLITADAMKSNMDIKLELRDVPDLLLNDKEIRQLILNLTRNGFEAMSEGGRLIIKTYVDSQDVVMSISDQGCGIAPDSLDKVGTPFFTTKADGTGLGLATCFSVAERNNAVIEVETGPAGTTFYVRFKLEAIK